MKIESLKDKKILILGFGREGKDTLSFLQKKFPGKRIQVADKSEKVIKRNNVKFILGKDYLKDIARYDVIIKSPGIPPLKELRDLNITSKTELFLDNCPGKVIGITGTKGKSTTASLTYEILKKSGIGTHLVGNIGKPALSFLNKAKENDVFVYELSSHQLFNIKKSPQVAVFLNIFPEHLDYYRNFKEYIKAKANITKYQKKEEYLVFNKKDKIVKRLASKSKAKKIPFNSVKVKNIIPQKDIPLKGKFNLNNIKAAIATVKVFNVPNKKIASAIKNFKPLPHRLEFVGEYKGISFYNDALSTVPEATIGAIEALGNDVQTIILGGFERNISFDSLAEKILRSNVQTLILFPTT